MKAVFSRTNAQMAALDTTAFAILPTTPGMVVIPKRLHVYKPAGVAYTITAGSFLRVLDLAGQVQFAVPAEGFLDQTTAESRIAEAGQGTFDVANTGVSLDCTKGIAAAAATQPTVYFEFTYDFVPLVIGV